MTKRVKGMFTAAAMGWWTLNILAVPEVMPLMVPLGAVILLLVWRT